MRFTLVKKLNEFRENCVDAFSQRAALLADTHVDVIGGLVEKNRVVGFAAVGNAWKAINIISKPVPGRRKALNVRRQSALFRCVAEVRGSSSDGERPKTLNVGGCLEKSLGLHQY